MLADFPGLWSLVLLFSESSQLSVPGLPHVAVRVSKTAAERACSCRACHGLVLTGCSSLGCHPRDAGMPHAAGMPRAWLVKPTTSPAAPVQELPLPEVSLTSLGFCWGRLVSL